MDENFSCRLERNSSMKGKRWSVEITAVDLDGTLLVTCVALSRFFIHRGVLVSCDGAERCGFVVAVVP